MPTPSWSESSGRGGHDSCHADSVLSSRARASDPGPALPGRAGRARAIGPTAPGRAAGQRYPWRRLCHAAVAGGAGGRRDLPSRREWPSEAPTWAGRRHGTRVRRRIGGGESGPCRRLGRSSGAAPPRRRCPGGGEPGHTGALSRSAGAGGTRASAGRRADRPPSPGDSTACRFGAAGGRPDKIGSFLPRPFGRRTPPGRRSRLRSGADCGLPHPPDPAPVAWHRPGCRPAPGPGLGQESSQ